MELVNTRQRRRIDRIAAYDNACGMDADTLRMALQFGNGAHLDPANQRGIGKFGMGLPNASISQCRLVEVWTWQNGKCLYTHLNLDKIEQKNEMTEVPEPKKAKIPEEWCRRLSEPIGDHGTLVVWSHLDRVTWKSSRALLDNAEFLIGRLYRYFIHDGKATIRLVAIDEGADKPDIDRSVRANDPLYLMTGTTAPEPYDAQPGFIAVGDPHPFEVTLPDGGKSTVTLRYSIVKSREEHGSSKLGQQAAKNQGVSVVRAGRELELNSSFDNSYDPRERWWGIEVRFDPDLDDLFGVTNNKQAATAFRALDLDGDAKLEGLSAREFMDRLRESNDPRWLMYELSTRIHRTLNDVLRPQIKRMKEGSRKGAIKPPPTGPEVVGTRAVAKRQEEGHHGASDKDEKQPPEQRQQQIEDKLVESGTPPPEAKEIAIEWVKSKYKFLFQEASIPGSVLFDTRSVAGTLFISINKDHPAYEHLFGLLDDPEAEADSPEMRALKLILCAWARLEDETTSRDRKRLLEDVRSDWGRMARLFLEEAEND